MKKQLAVLFFLNAFFLLQSKGQQGIKEDNKGYVIQGKLEGLNDGSLIFLTRKSRRDAYLLDTISAVRSTGDSFLFRGSLSHADEGEGYFINLDSSEAAYKHLRKKWLLLHLENSNITLTGSIDRMSPWNITVKGSSVHEDLMNYNTLAQKKGDSDRVMLEKKQGLLGIGDGDSAKEEHMKIFFGELAKMKQHFFVDWFLKHPNSLISPWLLSSRSDSLQAELFPKLSKRAATSFYGLIVKRNMARNQLLGIGKIAPELNLAGVDAAGVSLLGTANRNKITIVDFWAYWCKPCRESFPAMKELYQQYHSKGLEVYGVSTDPLKTAWLKALKQDDLPWINVISDEKRTPSDLYGIKGIPMYYVLDHQGKILMKFAGMDKEQKTKLKKLLEERL